jgi:hypothetical protein
MNCRIEYLANKLLWLIISWRKQAISIRRLQEHVFWRQNKKNFKKLTFLVKMCSIAGVQLNMQLNLGKTSLLHIITLFSDINFSRK